jgi:hypothetical protein
MATAHVAVKDVIIHNRLVADRMLVKVYAQTQDVHIECVQVEFIDV